MRLILFFIRKFKEKTEKKPYSVDMELVQNFSADVGDIVIIRHQHRCCPRLRVSEPGLSPHSPD